MNCRIPDLNHARRPGPTVRHESVTKRCPESLVFDAGVRRVALEPGEVLEPGRIRPGRMIPARTLGEGGGRTRVLAVEVMAHVVHVHPRREAELCDQHLVFE